jgi:hypothetical protein
MSVQTSIEFNPKDFAGIAFPPHGRFSAIVDGNVFRVDATGPFNTEMAMIYVQKAGPLIIEMSKQGPLGVVFHLKESMMMSPDAVQVFSVFLQKARASGLRTVGTALVANAHVEGWNLMSGVLKSQVYEPAGVPLAVFESITDADRWLASQFAVA